MAFHLLKILLSERRLRHPARRGQHIRRSRYPVDSNHRGALFGVIKSAFHNPAQQESDYGSDREQ